MGIPIPMVSAYWVPVFSIYDGICPGKGGQRVVALADGGVEGKRCGGRERGVAAAAVAAAAAAASCSDARSSVMKEM